ncbi:hypothetical protein Ciccas_006225 [Cichlidogyrus casuarinus]|uniref:Cadherin domain-containing protein n=1 Tax=Cichlidogyrus casuarinus TaxID=1844966 RepID=A0ABD2Q6E7_9PLAT
MRIVILNTIIVTLFGVLSAHNLTFSLTETSPIGYVVGRLPDHVSKSNVVSVTFMQIDNPYFKVAEDGTITVLSNLDRDKDRGLCIEPGFPKTCQYSTVVMSSTGEYYSLKFIIYDSNDNSPSWPLPSFLIEISEHAKTGHIAEIPTATDPDFGDKSVTKYSLKSDANSLGMFDVISEQELIPGSRELRLVPKLKVLMPLDREKIEWYNLTLMAEDGTQPFHTGSLVLNVHVMDENDHTPKFVSKHYSAVLQEYYHIGGLVPVHPVVNSGKSPTDAPMPRFEAYDDDSGDNGRIDYLFAVSTPATVRDTFSLDSLTGQLRIKKELSYEKGPTSWNFDILARDRGRPPKTGTAKVTIQLVDSINHAPIIKVRFTDEKDPNAIHIIENSEPSLTSLATITVIDKDDGRSGEFECRLSGSGEEAASSSFHLNLTSKLGKFSAYHLFNSMPFDREDISDILINIYCHDFGEIPQKSVEAIKIVIDDVNDNAPRFSQKQYYFKVSALSRSTLISWPIRNESIIASNCFLSLKFTIFHWADNYQQQVLQTFDGYRAVDKLTL